ncbi:hypothetical protein [Herpetosiphon giganteus]|uniref:hypothetical protein n=1 Tax=Herpetosiphon giganteus TaxID=2029754 RepID=UPI0019583B7E|nr:hypothetical protein [Herpetosiphon giganteus]MBM7846415.1 hypothetical protein [Herpetosiphon giganteus]
MMWMIWVTMYLISTLSLLTPAMVHGGTADAVVAARQVVLTAAADRHPERFVQGPPTPPPVPTAAWINPPLSVAAQADDPARLKRNS